MRTETAVTFFSLGFLAGLILGFASCSTTEIHQPTQMTTERAQ